MRATSLFALLLACALCFSLLGCGSQPVASDDFDLEEEGIIKLILSDTETGELTYRLIGPDGRSAETEEFESASLTALYADTGAFQFSYADGKLRNTLVSDTVLDESGSAVVPDAEALAILTQTAECHDRAIVSLTIIRCNGLSFPLVELDETDSPSVILYYFNPETQRMTQLYSLDRAAVGGMQIVDPDNLP